MSFSPLPLRQHSGIESCTWPAPCWDYVDVPVRAMGIAEAKDEGHLYVIERELEEHSGVPGSALPCSSSVIVG